MGAVVLLVPALHVPAGVLVCLVRGGVSAPLWPSQSLLLVPPAVLVSGGRGGEFRP